MPTYRIQLRRGTASEWTSADPTLSLGELGYETDTGNVKIGDGSTSWNSLSRYFGVQGTTGTQGSTGTQGTTGSQGIQGRQGTTGTQGSTGTQGTTGAGTQGATGTQGSTGTQGTTGTGTQGTTGAQGADGSGGGASVTVSDTEPVSPSAGDLWFDSTLGSLRVYYDDGDSEQWVDATVATVGVQGTAGAQGTSGTSVQGADGAQGTTGAQGADGATGDFLSLTQVSPRQQVNSQIWFSSASRPTITDGVDLVTEYEVGYLHMPVATKTSNFTLQLVQSGKLVYFNSGNVFIANDATVSHTIGTSIGIFNNSSSIMYITPNTNVILKWVGFGDVGTRSLDANGMASIIKVAANNWLISGVGVS